MLNRNTFGIGAPRAAHGFDAAREVQISSDLADQEGRQREYEQLAGLFNQVGETLKSMADAWTLPRASNAGPSYLHAAATSLKLAKSAVRRAELDDEDGTQNEDDEDGEDSVDKAEKHLAKAKKLLARAVDADEDEDGIEKTRDGVRKVVKSIATLKAERAARAAAPAAGAAVLAAKAQDLQDSFRKIVGELGGLSRNVSPGDVAKLSAKVDVLKGSLRSIIETVGGGAIAGGLPPCPSIAKAATAEPVNFARLINQADATGALNRQEVLRAKVLASRLNASRGDADATRAVDFEIAHAPRAVKKIFEAVV